MKSKLKAFLASIILTGGIVTYASSDSIHVFAQEKNELDGKVVMIDPAHGGLDTGAVNGKDTEAKLTYKIAKAVQKKLEKKGADVILTRTNDKTKRVSITSRKQMIEKVHPDFLISLHVNNSSKKSNEGVSAYFVNDLDKPFAQDLQENTAKILHMKENKSSSLTSDHATTLLKLQPAVNDMHASLMEIGFMSNKDDLSTLKKKKTPKKIANVLTKAIVNETKSQE